MRKILLATLVVSCLSLGAVIAAPEAQQTESVEVAINGRGLFPNVGTGRGLFGIRGRIRDGRGVLGIRGVIRDRAAARQGYGDRRARSCN